MSKVIENAEKQDNVELAQGSPADLGQVYVDDLDVEL